MQSIESFKLKESPVKQQVPKPPPTYFPSKPIQTQNGSNVKPSTLQQNGSKPTIVQQNGSKPTIVQQNGNSVKSTMVQQNGSNLKPAQNGCNDKSTVAQQNGYNNKPTILRQNGCNVKQNGGPTVAPPTYNGVSKVAIRIGTYNETDHKQPSRLGFLEKNDSSNPSRLKNELLATIQRSNLNKKNEGVRFVVSFLFDLFLAKCFGFWW